MARTIAEIKQAMVDQKTIEPGLNGLTSTSQTAVWNLIFFICAVGIKIIEDLFVALESDIEARKLELPSGVLKWYADETINFQFGDSLVFQNNFVDEDGVTITTIGKNLVYDPIVPANRIVDLAASDIDNGLVTIKAAKLVADVAEKLSVSELAGLNAYWIERRFAGTAINIISTDPDLMKASYTITYSAQILAADGSLLTSPSTFPVEDAIDDFLQTFQGVNFAGVVQVMKLTSAIEAANGVVNAVATAIEAKPNTGAYVDVLIGNQTYSTTAGYMKIDPAFPLSGSLTYTAG